jgi:hypothetical protein
MNLPANYYILSNFYSNILFLQKLFYIIPLFSYLL